MIREYVQSDYAMLSDWWDQHKFPRPPEGILPATGYIANDMAAGFLYLTNSPLAWIEWVVSDPKAEKVARGGAVDSLINFICDQAKLVHCTSVFTSSNSWPFIARLERLKFIKGDENTTQLFRRL